LLFVVSGSSGAVIKKNGASFWLQAASLEAAVC
jgi:hypothetical protein